MRKLDIRNLYYITHIDNLPSILEMGILSHERIEEERVQTARIYNKDIVSRRRGKNTPDQKSLSLAMPALGCGLGGLDWKVVGPLMCKYLHGIGIDVAIYLPREHPVPRQYLTESHLLAS